MRGSTLLPWLLVGPIFLGMSSMLLYQFSGAGWLATVAKLALGFALIVIVLSVAANLRALRHRRFARKTGV